MHVTTSSTWHCCTQVGVPSISRHSPTDAALDGTLIKLSPVAPSTTLSSAHAMSSAHALLESQWACFLVWLSLSRRPKVAAQLCLSLKYTGPVSS